MKLRLTTATILLLGGVAFWFLGRTTKTSQLHRDQRQRVSRASRVSSDDSGTLSWLVEPGVSGRHISGVVQLRGAPLADARVELRNYQSFFGGAAPPRVITDSQGRFDFGTQSPTTHVVVATADGLAPSITVVPLDDPSFPSPDKLILRLQACTQLAHGTVRDEAGRAIANASVDGVANVGQRAGSVPLYGTLSDAYGRFAVCAERMQLVVSARGYASVALGQRQPATGWDVILHPASSIEGRVLAGDDGALAGVVVTLEPAMLSNTSAPRMTTISTNDGSFWFEGVAPGDYSISGYGEHSYSTDLDMLVPDIHIDPAEHMAGVLLRMTTCERSVSGRVHDEDGPVVGATVSIGREAVTQADGSFVIGCVPGGSSVPIPIRVYDYDMHEPASLPADTGSIDDLILQVSHRAQVRGRVIDTGEAVPGAIVAVGDPKAPLMLRSVFGEHHRTRTLDDGSYVLRGLPTGETELYAIDPVNGHRSAATILRITGKEIRRGVDIDLSHAAIIRGRVRDSNGSPIANMKIRISGPNIPPKTKVEYPAAVSDDKGVFEIGGLGPGTYELQAARLLLKSYEPEGSLSVKIATSSDVVAAEITVSNLMSLSIRGRALFDDGSPVKFARVRADLAEANADAEGRFTLEGISAGTHKVSIFAIDGARGELLGVQAGSTDLIVVVPRVGSINARIDKANGSCAIRATRTSTATSLDLSLPYEQGDPSTTRDIYSDGNRFLIKSVPAGVYRLIVQCGVGIARGTVMVEPGATATVSLTMGAPGSIDGSVWEFPSGDPVGGISCFAGDARASTDATGAFHLVSVPPGAAVEVICMRIGVTTSVMGKAMVSVAPGASSRVNVYTAIFDEQRDAQTPGTIDASLVPATYGDTPALAFSEVVNDGAAAIAGLKNGDLLVSIDGASALGNQSEAARLHLLTRSSGSQLTLVISRGGATLTATVTCRTKADVE